jgi:hypothetical protein
LLPKKHVARRLKWYVITFSMEWAFAIRKGRLSWSLKLWRIWVVPGIESCRLLPKVPRSFVPLSSNFGSPRRLLGLFYLKSEHPINPGTILGRSTRLYIFSEWFRQTLKSILPYSLWVSADRCLTDQSVNLTAYTFQCGR